jgi:hypothetical protein
LANPVGDVSVALIGMRVRWRSFACDGGEYNGGYFWNKDFSHTENRMSDPVIAWEEK